MIGGLIGGIASGVATELGAASAIGQGNKPMIDHLRMQAIPRIGVWAALAVWSLVRVKNIITGEGSNIAFDELPPSTGTKVAGIAITLGITALCALAAWRTFSVERKQPAAGTLWFPGYRLPLFGEWTLATRAGSSCSSASGCGREFPRRTWQGRARATRITTARARRSRY